MWHFVANPHHSGPNRGATLIYPSLRNITIKLNVEHFSSPSLEVFLCSHVFLALLLLSARNDICWVRKSMVSSKPSSYGIFTALTFVYNVITGAAIWFWALIKAYHAAGAAQMSTAFKKKKTCTLDKTTLWCDHSHKSQSLDQLF